MSNCRVRLTNGLKLTHKQLGNHQLVSQFLTVLGSLALALHDTGQALDILKSSLTIAKTLHDIPTQIGVLSELTGIGMPMQSCVVKGCRYSSFDYVFLDAGGQLYIEPWVILQRS